MNHSHTKNGFYHLMTQLKDFKILILLLFSLNLFSQNKISGVVSSSNGERLSQVEIFVKNSDYKTATNKKGEFTLDIVNLETCELVFYRKDYDILNLNYTFSKEQLVINLIKSTLINEVVIQSKNEKIAAVNKLKDIDETAIYAGKKTEVISIDKLNVNKATNNARQIFAQIVGLTINESSDGGLQLSIGGRGLDPNRTSNFNTRQNGYDISADVLGYPESYYTTPTEALEEIQIVRGAASLQYGTQFGGLVNFKLKKPSLKNFEIVTRNTVGSYNLFTNFTSVSGTKNKFSYYSFYNYKQGDGFRPNSDFESKNYFANLNYQFSQKTSLHFDYTYFTYLAQQAGGLTDVMFLQDPQQSNRTRNWFDVNWNLFALRLKHKFNSDSDFSMQLFGLDASRKAVGYRSNRVSNPDTQGTERDLILGDFTNWGTEVRYLQRYKINGNTSAFLIGSKYYQAKNTGAQGPGSSGSDANFNLATDEFPFYRNQSDYVYPNLNISIFGENIFKITSKFSITPGFRYENIKTQAQGFYREIRTDLAGNVFYNKIENEDVVKKRDFFLFGIGLSYKALNGIELYGNVSQNYRSVTFNDIRTANPSSAISENITDEKGYTSDIGIRGKINNKVSFDTSVFALYYNDKIGEYDAPNPNGSAASVRFRDNIGTALTYGFEAMIDWSISKTFFNSNENFVWNIYTNSALTNSEYLKSDAPNIQGNKVEFVPFINFKSGTSVGYKNFLASLQFTYVSSQFTDADNNKINLKDNTYGIFGEIPEYYVADFSCSYKFKYFKLESGISNFTNNFYYTRRATGYPGPGIIPSENRVFYTTLEFKF